MLSKASKAKETEETTIDKLDPYYQYIASHQNRLPPPMIDSITSRKWKIFKTEIKGLSQKALNGFILGGIMGAAVGAIFGCYYAFVYKSLLIIPVSALVSSCSFGFFMACGSLVRTDDFKKILALKKDERNDYFLMKIGNEFKIVKKNGDSNIKDFLYSKVREVFF